MVRILVVDNSSDFVDTLKSHLVVSGGIEFDISWKEDLGPDKSVSKFDLFIIGNHLNGGTRTISIVESLRLRARPECVFVVSSHGDFEFLKELFKLRIGGFLDQNNLDLDTFIEMASIVNSTKDSFYRLSAKLDGLKAI